MAIVINGSGTVTGLSVGGLPDGTVDSDTLASGIDKTSISDSGDATAITIDSSENVGFGVTPETDWYPKVIQSGNRGAVYGYSNQTHLSNNAKMIDVSENYKYMESSYATDYSQEGGTHQFKVAPSGSADAAITWTTAMTINNSGIVTMPKQPAFLVNARQSAPNIAVNANTTAQFTEEVYDVNADYNTSTYTFTAPVTGKYQLNCSLLWINWDASANYYYLKIVTSNRTYYELFNGGERSSDVTYAYGHIHVLADMDANDTAYVELYQNSGAQQTNYENQSVFGGFLAC